jgi:hypothetical protein
MIRLKTLLLTENQMTKSDFNQIGNVLRDPVKAKQIHDLLIQMFPKQKELLDYNYKNDSYAEFKRFIFNIDKFKLEEPVSINHTDLKLDPQVMKDREKKYQDYIDGKVDKYFRDTDSDPRNVDLSKMPPITIDSNGEVMDGNHRAFLAIKQQKPLKAYKIVNSINTNPNVAKILQIIGRNSQTQNIDIIVNYAEVDLNYSNMSIQKSGVLDSQFVEETLGDIEAYIEDNNIDGGSRFDITRMVSDIKFDCSININNDEIDITIMLDADGDVISIDIQDDDIADKYGINDQWIQEYLSKQGL